MKETEYMAKGMLYTCQDNEEIFHLQDIRNEFLDLFNQTSYKEIDKRVELIKKYFGHVGKNPTVNKPFHCDYGKNIYVGDNFYMNFDGIILDVNKVTIGNNVFIAPRVCIYTAGHPIDKDIRNEQLEYGYPVTIGDDVWIGGNVIINPGVTIGSNVVIGSGSVVCKDIPSNVVACGNPCKVVREITEEDRRYWQQEKDKRFKQEE